MFFLNLTAGEFFTLLGAVGGLITALYLLDQSKRKKVVSTLALLVSRIELRGTAKPSPYARAVVFAASVIGLAFALVGAGAIAMGKQTLARQRSRSAAGHVRLVGVAWRPGHAARYRKKSGVRLPGASIRQPIASWWFGWMAWPLPSPPLLPIASSCCPPLTVPYLPTPP